jgi:four helix bundle protein
MDFMFEALDVYQRAVDLAEQLILLCRRFPRAEYAVGNQLRRAAVSVPCNIAEANGRAHAKDRKRFLIIARGSAFECVPLVDIAKRLRLLTPEEYRDFRAQLLRISKTLSALAKGEDRKLQERAGS